MIGGRIANFLDSRYLRAMVSFHDPPPSPPLVDIVALLLDASQVGSLLSVRLSANQTDELPTDRGAVVHIPL